MRGNIGLPGDPSSDNPQTIKCPCCDNLARRQLNGLYQCTRNRMHILTKRDGSYALVDDDDQNGSP